MLQSITKVLPVLLSVITCGYCLTCYSSNLQSRLDVENGVETVCRPAFGAHGRFCLKFITEGRDNQVIRNCDFIYENFFGKDSMNERKEGCWRFETTLEGKPEKGIYCLCKGDRCNGGTVTEADLSPVPEDEENNEVQT